MAPNCHFVGAEAPRSAGAERERPRRRPDPREERKKERKKFVEREERKGEELRSMVHKNSKIENVKGLGGHNRYVSCKTQPEKIDFSLPVLLL